MKKKILALVSVLVLVAVLIVPMVVLAGNEATQGASTTAATTIEIRAQDYSATVATITFPEGAPSATVSTPSNDQAETQTFGGAGTAKPVVTLYNGGSVTYTIWYNITTFAPDNVVSNEYYLINVKGAACADADAITDAVTFDTDTATAATIVNGADNEKDLYLKITLSALAGKSGTSTLTILGES